MHMKPLLFCLVMVMLMIGLSNALVEVDHLQAIVEQAQTTDETSPQLEHEEKDEGTIKLQLPMPDEESSRTLQFGDTLALDDLGPIIINKDGSLRRITNWAELSAVEKKHTLRKVSLRNHKRLGVLKNNERLDIIQKYYEAQAVQSPPQHAQEEQDEQETETEPDL